MACFWAITGRIAVILLCLPCFLGVCQGKIRYFTSPDPLVTALSNIGADMSEEERQESTETILAAVIVGQIATQSAVAAAASAAAASSTYRRKP